MSNSFGTVLKISSFGESHGPAVGVLIDGCPAGLTIDEDKINLDLQRRKPGQSRITTARDEPETFEILSGVFEGREIALNKIGTSEYRIECYCSQKPRKAK